jgi:PleD family two-component response regulator
MGGELQVTSSRKKAAAFILPCYLTFQQQVMIVPKIASAALKQLTGVRVLLVEDNAVNMNIARRFLNSWGATIQTAENGEVAWQHVPDANPMISC